MTKYLGIGYAGEFYKIPFPFWTMPNLLPHYSGSSLVVSRTKSYEAEGIFNNWTILHIFNGHMHVREGRVVGIYFLIFAKQKQQSNGISAWLVCRKTEH